MSLLTNRRKIIQKTVRKNVDLSADRKEAAKQFARCNSNIVLD